MLFEHLVVRDPVFQRDADHGYGGLWSVLRAEHVVQGVLPEHVGVLGGGLVRAPPAWVAWVGENTGGSV